VARRRAAPGDRRIPGGQDPAFHRATGQDGYRDGCRVPIPWSGTTAPYGFGPAGGPSWLPQPPSWASLSVAAQEGVAGPTLTMYHEALALRRKVYSSAPASAARSPWALCRCGSSARVRR
jgi:alpha-glucosidase